MLFVSRRVFMCFVNISICPMFALSKVFFGKKEQKKSLLGETQHVRTSQWSAWVLYSVPASFVAVGFREGNEQNFVKKSTSKCWVFSRYLLSTVGPNSWIHTRKICLADCFVCFKHRRQLNLSPFQQYQSGEWVVEETDWLVFWQNHRKSLNAFSRNSAAEFELQGESTQQWLILNPDFSLSSLAEKEIHCSVGVKHIRELVIHQCFDFAEPFIWRTRSFCVFVPCTVSLQKTPQWLSSSQTTSGIWSTLPV